MTRSPDEPVRPGRLVAVLALFLVPGAAVALVLWHEVVNYLLSGRSPRISAWAILATLVAAGLVVAGLARYVRGLDGGPSS